jgi:hypothetical protein
MFEGKRLLKTVRRWSDSHHSQNVGALENSDHKFSGGIPFDTANAWRPYTKHYVMALSFDPHENEAYAIRTKIWRG